MINNVDFTVIPTREENNILITGVSISNAGIYFLGNIEKDVLSDLNIRLNLGRTSCYFVIPKGTAAGGYFPLKVGSGSGTASSQYNMICSMFKSDMGDPSFSVPIYAVTPSIVTDDYYKYTISTVSSSTKLEVSPKSWHILNAALGTNTYSEMTPGEAADEQTFYLMYGLKKTFFVDIADNSGVPTVSLSRESNIAPYLQYTVSPTSDSNIYRLDFWVDRYEDPLSYNATATPYTSDNTTIDTSSGDKTVIITVSVPGTTIKRTLTCNVLLKRFYVDLNQEGYEVKIDLWNPLELNFDVNIDATYKIRAITSRTGWEQAFYTKKFGTLGAESDKITEINRTFCFPSTNNSASYHYTSFAMPNIIRQIYNDLDTYHGTDLVVEEELHFNFGHPSSNPDSDTFMLVYPIGEIVSVNFKLSFNALSHFSVSPGLSKMAGSSFNLGDILSFSRAGIPTFKYKRNTKWTVFVNWRAAGGIYYNGDKSIESAAYWDPDRVKYEGTYYLPVSKTSNPFYNPIMLDGYDFGFPAEKNISASYNSENVRLLSGAKCGF